MDLLSFFQLHYMVQTILNPDHFFLYVIIHSALTKAQALIEDATSSDATLTSPFISKNVVFHEEVTRVLSPLDGQTEVGKFICIGMNYVDHCTEQNCPVPTVPLVFSKVRRLLGLLVNKCRKIISSLTLLILLVFAFQVWQLYRWAR